MSASVTPSDVMINSVMAPLSYANTNMNICIHDHTHTPWWSHNVTEKQSCDHAAPPPPDGDQSGRVPPQFVSRQRNDETAYCDFIHWPNWQMKKKKMQNHIHKVAIRGRGQHKVNGSARAAGAHCFRCCNRLSRINYFLERAWKSHNYSDGWKAAESSSGVFAFFSWI